MVRYALRLTFALIDSHAVVPGLATAVQWYVCCSVAATSAGASDSGKVYGQRTASSGGAEMGWC